MTEPRNSFWKRLPRPRLSLRMTMLAVWVFGCGLGWYAWTARRQAETVAEIRRSGGEVYYDWEYRDSVFATNNPRPPWPAWLMKHLGPDYVANVTHVKLGKPLVSLDDAALGRLRALRQLEWVDELVNPLRNDNWLARISQVDQIRVLTLDDTPITSQGFLAFKKLIRLELLDIPDRAIDDGDLANLSGLTKMKVLNLRADRITDAGLVHLQGMKNLKELELYNRDETGVPLPGALSSSGTPVITSNGLVNLADMYSLESLSLYRLRVTTLAPIRHLTSLRNLSLRLTTISDNGLAPISSLVGLESLDLWGTGITDAGMAHVAKLSNLEYLDIALTVVTDTGFAKLAGLSRLKQVIVCGDVSEEAIDALKAKIPGLEVLYFRGTM